MIVPQFVQLDIFLEAFERGVARKLLEAGDMDALGNAARDRAAAQAVTGEPRRVKPGAAGPVLDDERDRFGVDRTGTNPVAVGYRLSPRLPRDARRRQPPDPPEQRAFGDRRGGEPGLERGDRTETGLAVALPLNVRRGFPENRWFAAVLNLRNCP